MTEIEVFKQLAEGLGIGALIVIASAWLLSQGIKVYREQSKQSFEREKLRIENEQRERETNYKLQTQTIEANKHLADKTELATKALENQAKILERIQTDHRIAVEATKTAETNILLAINQAQDKHSTEIRKLGELIADLHTISRERATSDDVKKALSEIVASFESALSKVENRLINELTKIKIHESNKFKLSELPIPPPNTVSDSFDASKRDDNFTTGKADTL